MSPDTEKNAGSNASQCFGGPSIRAVVVLVLVAIGLTGYHRGLAAYGQEKAAITNHGPLFLTGWGFETPFSIPERKAARSTSALPFGTVRRGIAAVRKRSPSGTH